VQDDGRLSEAQKRQMHAEQTGTKERIALLKVDLELEPASIRELYHVARTRLTPVGMVYLAEAYQ
jgi:hypothetical protein